MAILTFDNVSKIFYTKTAQTVAVDKLSFEINEGEFVALIGPSGCGKTTILSLVCGLIEPTSGKIVRGKHKTQTDGNTACDTAPNNVGESDLDEMPNTVIADEQSGTETVKDNVATDVVAEQKNGSKEKKKFNLASLLWNRQNNKSANVQVGYMLQRDQLFEWRTIERNVTLGLEVQHKNTPENVAKARELLKKYGLWDFRKHYPAQLSGGMRQRAALIRTLATNPDLLLLDEPFSALDFQTRLEVCDDVYSIIKSENKTALLVTHDISEAISLADKVIVLTARPATLKEVHYTNLGNIDTPLNRRKSPDFAVQFDKLHHLLHGNV